MQKKILLTLLLPLLIIISVTPFAFGQLTNESDWISTDKNTYKVGEIIFINGYTTSQVSLFQSNGNVIYVAIPKDEYFKLEVLTTQAGFYYSGITGIKMVTPKGKILAETSFTIECGDSSNECKPKVKSDIETQITINQIESKIISDITNNTLTNSQDSAKNHNTLSESKSLTQNNANMQSIIDTESKSKCGDGTELVNGHCKVIIKSTDKNFFDWFMGLFS